MNASLRLCMRIRLEAEVHRLGFDMLRSYRYETKHGEAPEEKGKVVPYNCTNVVPVLPARMAIHSDSCTLWKKSGHIEDELKNHLLGLFQHLKFGLAACSPDLQHLLHIY